MEEEEGRRVSEEMEEEKPKGRREGVGQELRVPRGSGTLQVSKAQWIYHEDNFGEDIGGFCACLRRGTGEGGRWGPTPHAATPSPGLEEREMCDKRRINSTRGVVVVHLDAVALVELDAGLLVAALVGPARVAGIAAMRHGGMVEKVGKKGDGEENDVSACTEGNSECPKGEISRQQLRPPGAQQACLVV